ncbi:CXXC motif containing zinc binding protein, eukaryotic like protein [Aduncisulcus paluster]|uniref:CXXC motif containing zinc binding protein, eukaryotic like protein n=1 Tax=Aduncisulcus paluster TaxID=2918883 RepID=A0ABQ5KJP0_9EUKA|nr:CXXC motif containing zinc binding protein, eukaryotic like protein [Aduncisulcus paluster]
MEGITSIKPFSHIVNTQIKCTSCGHVHDGICIDYHTAIESKRGRGTFNLVMKCKDCKRDMTAVLMNLPSIEYTEENGSDFAKLVGIKTTGCEITGFVLEKFTGISEGGAPIDEIIIDEDGSFADYIDATDETVSIMEYDTKIEFTRSK